jgi:hypothetical protein
MTATIDMRILAVGDNARKDFEGAKSLSRIAG